MIFIECVKVMKFNVKRQNQDKGLFYRIGGLTCGLTIRLRSAPSNITSLFQLSSNALQYGRFLTLL